MSGPGTGTPPAAGLDGLRAEGLKATLALYWRDGERLRAELAAARAETAALRAELDHVFGSKSWRLTEPLRALRRRLGSRVP